MNSNDHLNKVRHSLAHILASTVQEKYPDIKLGIGPAIDDGFYYDFSLDAENRRTNAEERGNIKEGDLQNIEERMRELIKENLTFSRKEVSPDEARKEFQGEPYKLELIDELEKAKEGITLYTVGNFTDLCRGGHVKSTAEIDPDAFSLDRIAGAYWKGNEKNAMLTRVYGLAFETKEALGKYRAQRDEAKKRDHKKLGRELDLFYIDEEVGKGLPMWTPKGTEIKFELERFTRDLEKKYGYEHVSTPYLGSEKLYVTSGHLEHFKENMYAPIDMDGEIFYLRPMACPHHIKLLQRKPLSYRDMPVKYAEIADYNRFEKSGELMGLIRVRKFELTDAHVFTEHDKLEKEFGSVCELIREALGGLGISEKVRYRFSKHDPKDSHKYYPDEELWSKSEGVMKNVLEKIGFEYEEVIGEAAFYGPKLDVQIKNVNGKEDTIFTAQIDFLLPEKFNIEYTDSNGAKKRPVMIHRSAIGALERTFAFLIEHYGGAFPFWLAPIQIAVLPVGEGHEAYASDILKELKEAGMRAEMILNGETLGKRIREIKVQKIPYILVCGDKEVEQKSVTLEGRDEGSLGTRAKKDLVEFFDKCKNPAILQ
jgi:threonyl-tRNA synthetase